MSSCQKINSLTSPNFSFVQSGEYDVVSSKGILKTLILFYKFYLN